MSGGDAQPPSTDALTLSSSSSTGSSDYVVPHNVAVLTTPDGGVLYLLGTVHVSRESGEAVKQLIADVSPEVVCVELCLDRRHILSLSDSEPSEPRADVEASSSSSEPSAASSSSTPAASTAVAQAAPSFFSHVVSALRRGGGPSSALEHAFSEYLRRIGSKLDVMPGYEFRVAMRECQARRIPLILCDRPVHITLQRTWYRLSYVERVRFIWGLMTSSDDVDEEMVRALSRGGDLLDELVEELQREFPSLYRPLVEERDEYLAAMLREHTKRKRVVVGVVGLGHVKGIQRRWEDTNIDVRELLALPPPTSKAAKWAMIAGATVGAVASAAAVAFVAKFSWKIAARVLRAYWRR